MGAERTHGGKIAGGFTRSKMDNAAEKYGLLITATGNKDDAAGIAQMLVSDRLAACVQIMPIESFYAWKGALAHEAEWLLLIKTKTILFDDAIRAIKARHPYETPEIVGTEFSTGLPEYFSWIDESTR